MLEQQRDVKPGHGQASGDLAAHDRAARPAGPSPGRGDQGVPVPEPGVVVQTVYVVDDDAASRQSITSMLRSVGYTVEQFDSGATLLERAREGLAGCIVLDVRMPGVSGLEVQRRLAALDIRTPVIVVSGYADIAMAVQAMKANAFEFLTKPFRDQDLFDAIGAAMEVDSSRSMLSRERRHADRLIRNLTSREHEVFVRLCTGQMGKQIAHELGMSEATVKVHRRAILHKLNVKHLAELILTYAPMVKSLSEEPG